VVVAVAVILGAVPLSWVASMTPIPNQTLLQAIEDGTAPIILDVRTAREYEAGHVPGAIRVPYHAVWVRRAHIPARIEDRLVVYCSHGLRAGMAALQLRLLGYQEVAQLRGHMSDWKRSGLPVKNGREP
jgi:rhodanese-related sulfurtransferase